MGVAETARRSVSRIIKRLGEGYTVDLLPPPVIVFDRTTSRQTSTPSNPILNVPAVRTHFSVKEVADSQGIILMSDDKIMVDVAHLSSIGAPEVTDEWKVRLEDEGPYLEIVNPLKTKPGETLISLALQVRPFTSG